MEEKIHYETLPDGTVVEHREDHDDAKTAAKMGGVGGAVVGGIAGSALGPGGTVVGAVVGGIAGAAGSGAAVDAIDKHDDDSTITGLQAERKLRDKDHRVDAAGNRLDEFGNRIDEFGNRIAQTANDLREKADRAMDTNNTPGIQTGGHAADGTRDTRGITEKIADKLTGNEVDDKTGKSTDD